MAIDRKKAGLRVDRSVAIPPSAPVPDFVVGEPGFAVGHVVDFIYTPWMMPAIYNVADMFIVTMMNTTMAA